MTPVSPLDLPATPDLTGTNWGDVDEREVLDYDAATNTYRATFDPDTDRSELAIVSVVAAISGTPPLELPPLYPAIDPEAVESHVESTPAGSAPERTALSATYDGYTVTVHCDGVIAVQPPRSAALD